MRGEQMQPVEEHLPRGERRGCIMVVSDYRLLNLAHAGTLCAAGYAVYTAVTCTDVPRVFELYVVGHVDLVAFASLVHGWHHEENEGRPTDIPPATDATWQVRNIRQVIDTICARQDAPPTVLIAVDLLSYSWYDISAEALAAAGIEYQTYSASSPHSILSFLSR